MRDAEHRLREPKRRLEAVAKHTPTVLARSGVLRDSYGRPLFDVAPEMHPVYARGLYADHGVYHEMVRSDAAIAGVIGALRRSIAYGHFQLKGGTPLARALCAAYLGLPPEVGIQPERVSWAIRGGLARHVYQAARSLDYGFALFEIEEQLVEWRGRQVVVPSGVSWIAPWSVEKWLWQGDRLVGLVQRYDQQSGWLLGNRTREIPINQCLLYTHDAADGNPEGTSALRPLWIPWRVKKDTILRQQTAKDTLFGGMGWIQREVPSGDAVSQLATQREDTDDLRMAEEALDAAMAGETSRVTVPFGYKLDIKHPEYEIPDETSYLTWMNAQIFAGLSAILYGLGQSHAGSSSMSERAEDLLFATQRATASEILEVTNGLPGLEYTGLLSRIVERNFAPGEGEQPPTLEPTQFANIERLATVVTKLAQFRVITPTAEDEASVRGAVGLDTFDIETIRANREAAQEAPTQVSQESTQ